MYVYSSRSRAPITIIYALKTWILENEVYSENNAGAIIEALISCIASHATTKVLGEKCGVFFILASKNINFGLTDKVKSSIP